MVTFDVVHCSIPGYSKLYHWNERKDMPRNAKIRQQKCISFTTGMHHLKPVLHWAILPVNSLLRRCSCGKTTSFCSFGSTKNRSFCHTSGATIVNSQAKLLHVEPASGNAVLQSCQRSHVVQFCSHIQELRFLFEVKFGPSAQKPYIIWVVRRTADSYRFINTMRCSLTVSKNEVLYTNKRDSISGKY